jgi:hypothetical protein
MAEEEKKLAIALPGEWALQKVFGPALTEIGEDFRKVYAKGRDKLVAAALRKVENPEDGRQANLRVTRDVLWNGAFTEDEVCAEYFGGILAASRSDDGKDDSAIQFVDVIKSLSAKQLRLHYVIYHSLNSLFVAAKAPVNVGQGTELGVKGLWFSELELTQRLVLPLETDLNILLRQGLISEYKTDVHKLAEARFLPYAMVRPTTFGVLLYASAHNKQDEWRTFDQRDFGAFPDVDLPVFFAPSIDELQKAVVASIPSEASELMESSNGADKLP